jgi:hypothetical protein
MAYPKTLGCRPEKGGKDMNNEYENMRCLYNEYATRARNKGAHIWITAAIFIPASLSGVALLGENPSPRSIWIPVVSIFLILTWHCLSEAWKTRLEKDEDRRDKVGDLLGFSKGDLNQPRSDEDAGDLGCIRFRVVSVIVVFWIVQIVWIFYKNGICGLICSGN